MTGIQDLKIRGSVVSPSSPAYEQAIARWSAVAIRRAAYVIYPEVPSDIAEILQFTRSQEPPLDVSVKCGGHDATGASSSEGGIVIDLARINHVNVADDRKTVAIGGGALWGHIYAEIEKHDIEVVGGAFGSIGVGGFTIGGGYSVLSSYYGLALDNIVQATVVLADGHIVVCAIDSDPDLFWAIRGAGSQFGVVVEFVLKAYPAHGPSRMDMFAYPGNSLPAVLKALRVFLSAQKPGEKVSMVFCRTPPHFHPSIIVVTNLGETEKAEDKLSAFHADPKPVFHRSDVISNLVSYSRANDATLYNDPPRVLSGTAVFSELWDDVITTVFSDWASFTESEECNRSIVLWELIHSGKIAEVDTEATAFPTRMPHYYAAVIGRHKLPETDPVTHKWVSKIVSYIKNTSIERTGVDLPTPAYTALPGSEDVADVYGKNYARLRKLKAKYDPHKVWNKGYTIEPDFN